MLIREHGSEAHSIARNRAVELKAAGDEAPIHAAMQADAMLEKGDLDGAAVWRRIVKAIEELQREELGPGERRH